MALFGADDFSGTGGGSSLSWDHYYKYFPQASTQGVGTGISSGWSSSSYFGRVGPRRQTQTRYQYRHSHQSDLATRRGVRSTRNNQEPYTLPPARFNELGGVRLCDLDDQIMDPRVFAMNGGRKWVMCGLTGTGSSNQSGPFLNGTWSTGGSATSSDGTDDDGNARLCTSTTSAGSDASWIKSVTTGGMLQRRHRQYFYIKFKLSHTTGYRFFAPIASAGTLISADSPTVAWVGLKYVPSISATFALASGDATTASDPTYITNVTPTANTLYHLEMWADSDSLRGRINGGTIFTHTDNLPADDLDMDNIAHGAQLRSVTAGTAYSIRAYDCAAAQG